ncbi:M24 family metallopeptidase [Telmatocola sphagniphila]|uniref:M24 family metallopeptidase n=1 Tax=Telmatocola sphagniphila TaxID=1123043 RepID=A0A8E6B9N5_9BACT|nr:M24 family metallopeptidase [Telmatocola sphagniphila]QVL34452.1 M24 family metallopeptidase [Telmatocola sphagniphila]
MFDLSAVQAALQQMNLDGWLLYDFRGLNILAKRVVCLPENQMLSRRWFYYVPAKGTPQKLSHKIEPAALDQLPGDNHIYLRWQELEAGVKKILGNAKKIAMEYVAFNRNPYISRVDAGTIEIVKALGLEIVPSGDLIQLFEACWSDEQWEMHKQACVHTDSAYTVAANFIASEIRAKGFTTEIDVQTRIMKHFADNGLTTYSPPIVGEGPHSGDPHYSPSLDHNFKIEKGDFVLIDLWAKVNKPNAVYSDLTRTFFVGTEVPEKYTKVFKVVAAARDAGIQIVKDHFKKGIPLYGWQVDDATRKVIDDAGYGEYFCHRTGHSIGQEVHGNGAHMDNLETREERRVLPRTCFSIEPGIYRAEFGVRSEINVYVDAKNEVHVTAGELQQEIIKIVV